MKILTKCLSLALALAMPLGAFAQNVTVKGQVKDASGEPVVSANYTLTVPSDASIQFSFMQNHYAAGDPIPTDPNHNGDFYGTSKYIEEATGNPLFQRDKTDASSGGFNIRGTMAANLTPISDLTITSRLGYTIAQSNSHSYQAPYWLTSMASSTTYSISAAANTGYMYQWENFANCSTIHNSFIHVPFYDSLAKINSNRCAWEKAL